MQWTFLADVDTKDAKDHNIVKHVHNVKQSDMSVYNCLFIQSNTDFPHDMDTSFCDILNLG